MPLTSLMNSARPRLAAVVCQNETFAQARASHAEVVAAAGGAVRPDSLSLHKDACLMASNRFHERLLQSRQAASDCSVQHGLASTQDSAGAQEAREQVLKKHRDMTACFAGRLCQATLAHGSALAFATMIKPGPDPREQKQFAGFVADTQKQMALLSDAPPGVEKLLATTGSAVFFEQLLALIGFIKSDYLSNYEFLIEQYSGFYTDFNEKIMATMGSFITSKDDGKQVEINGSLMKALDPLIAQYSKAPNGQLYPPASSPLKPTSGEAAKWARAMGLDPSTSVKVVGDKYVVMMDIMPLITLKKSLTDLGMTGNPPTAVTVDSAKFQSWQSGFNSQESEMKNQLSVFTTKYSNSNAYYENFNKILSSQLSQYAEMLKAYLAGLGG